MTLQVGQQPSTVPSRRLNGDCYSTAWEGSGRSTGGEGSDRGTDRSANFGDYYGAAGEGDGRGAAGEGGDRGADFGDSEIDSDLGGVRSTEGYAA